MDRSTPASLYTAEFMDHIAHPDYKYKMEDPTFTHYGVNPSCGDELTFSVRIGDDGKIAETAYQGHGCAVSQVSADMMSDLMEGKTPEEAIELCKLFGRMARGEETDDAKLEELGDAASLKDVSHMPARVKCAELAWRTLEEMLENGSGKPGETATASCVMPPHSHHDDSAAPATAAGSAEAATGAGAGEGARE